MMPRTIAQGERGELLRAAARDAGVAACALLGLAALGGAALGLGGTHALKAIALFGLGVLLVAPLLPAGHPHARLGPANRVTLARAAGVALLAAATGEPPTVALAASAVALGSLMAALDGVDGWLARRSGLASEFGARFDMETDAAFVLVLAVLAWQWNKAGAWVLAGGLLRYAFVAAGAAFEWMRQPLPPSRRRQAICVVQVIAMLVVLAPFVPRPWSAPIAAATLAVLAGSFCADTLWLARQRRPDSTEGSR